MTSTTRLVAATLLSAIATMAQASTATAKVTLSDLSIFAFDLVPTDAYLPSFQLVSPEFAPIGIEILESGTTLTKSGSGMLSSLDLSSTTTPGQQISAHLDGTGLDIDLAIDSDQDAHISANAHKWITIQVAPGTGIVASGTLLLSSACAATAPNLCQVSSSAKLTLLDYGNARPGFSQELGTTGLGLPLSMTLPAAVAYLNVSNQTVPVYLSVEGRAAAILTSVPEPGMWALMLAGAVGVGVAGRRRA